MKRNSEKDWQKRVNEAAHRSIESMRDDLDALNHAQECNGTNDNGKPCKRGSETRTIKLSDGSRVKQHKHENPDAWHDEDAARRVIDETPLSLEVRSDWHSIGDEDGNKPTEYRILLGTGGPACQIVGDLDEYGQPETAFFEYQDWFKPWTRPTDLSSDEESTLLEWVQNFTFSY